MRQKIEFYQYKLLFTAENRFCAIKFAKPAKPRAKRHGLVLSALP